MTAEEALKKRWPMIFDNAVLRRMGMEPPIASEVAEVVLAAEGKRTPPVEDMTCEEALAEAQAQMRQWRERALTAEGGPRFARAALDEIDRRENE